MSLTIRFQSFSTAFQCHYFMHLRRERRLFSAITNKTKIQELIIDKSYFQLIKNIQKTVEGRIYKNHYTNINPGDVIKFKDSKNFQNTIFCQVKSKALYGSFREMLEKEGLEHCLPGVRSLDEGVKVYHSFPDYEEESRKYQVVAFKIFYLSNITFGDGL